MKWLVGLLVVFSLYGNERFLVYGGKTGWIGQKIVLLLQQSGHQVFCAQSRLENRNDILREIDAIKPTRIINAAGVTGTPNVDWCEDHKQETMLANVIGALVLADVAQVNGVHLTHLGTGCIYEYDKDHSVGSGVGFKEDDTPNFDGSFYSLTKGLMQRLLSFYPNVLILRMRMPISADLSPRNFITKITKYKKVINVANSMTVLDDLLPIAIEMSLRKLTGTYNFTNPGTISHNEILDLYKKYVDQRFVYENFTIEEQNKILKAKRSNNELDVTKLLKIFPQIPSIKNSIEKIMILCVK